MVRNCTGRALGEAALLHVDTWAGIYIMVQGEAGTGRPETIKRARPALTEGTMTDFVEDKFGAPKVVDRNTFQAELDALRVREKAHTHEADAIAAARRRLPMV